MHHMVTIKQIADICGVSRGTVDRVLNNRGHVKPEKCKLILEAAKMLNYTINPAGRALMAWRKKPTVAIILPSRGIRFFDDVIDAMKQMESKYKFFGLKVIWCLLSGYNVKEQCDAIDKLKPDINALIINPINDIQVKERINQFIKDNIFVVTINNDIEDVAEHQYVGSDYVNGGQTAAALMKMIHLKDKCNIGIILGSMNILGHQQRLNGFRSVIENISNFEIIDVQEDNDDDFCAFECVVNMLQQHKNINAMFFASSGGAYGACRAILSLHKEQDLTVVAFDTIPGIIEMMHKGVVNAAIYQHPRQQGQHSMQIVCDYLINGIKPDHNKHIMKNDIRILQNV